MALGIAGAFHYGMAVRTNRGRMPAFAVGVLCVLGLVSSFARGAFLSLLAVVGWMWIRAPRKGAATVFAVAAAVGVFVASQLFTGTQRGAGTAANFFDEMATMFTEYQNSSGTTGDREILWGAAVRVWKQNPVFGAGGGNFGVFAASFFKPGEVGGDYIRNPKMLYDRKLHNVYFQILSEYGTVGSLLYLWLFIDFFYRNRRLRSPEFLDQWNSRGGRVDLKWISLGLSAIMIAFMVNGLFYNLVECDFLPATVIANALLYQLAKPARPSAFGGPVTRRYRYVD
jgi:O-antigen ligase